MGIEDNPRAFLLLILKTMSIILSWMIVHVLIGIYLGYGFFEDAPGWENFLYYGIFFISLYFLIKYIRRKWKL